MDRTIPNHDTTNCSACLPSRQLSDQEWLKKHTTRWCQNPAVWVGSVDTEGRFQDDLSRDGHTRCQLNGGLVSKTYQCQCSCHGASDEEIEEAAFKALQLVLRMQAEQHH